MTASKCFFSTLQLHELQILWETLKDDGGLYVIIHQQQFIKMIYNGEQPFGRGMESAIVSMFAQLQFKLCLDIYCMLLWKGSVNSEDAPLSEAQSRTNVTCLQASFVPFTFQHFAAD